MLPNSLSCRAGVMVPSRLGEQSISVSAIGVDLLKDRTASSLADTATVATSPVEGDMGYHLKWFRKNSTSVARDVNASFSAAAATGRNVTEILFALAKPFGPGCGGSARIPLDNRSLFQDKNYG